MQWLAKISVKRPVFATVLVLAFVVVGVLGYFRLPVDLFPKVEIPTVIITTSMPGASPQEIETELTNKIEEAVNTISGIDELQSTSSEGLSQVVVAFLLEKDGAVGAQEVRDRVNRILDDLPDAAEIPRVQQIDADAAPVLNVAVTADRPVREITEFADKVLRRQLESSAGVGQVNLLGGRSRQINVQLDPVRLRAFNLTALDVEQALRRQNVQIPAGTVQGDARQSGLRVEGKFESVEKLAGLVVRHADGALVRLSDVAQVEDGEEEQQSVARRNGIPAVVLSIRKQSGENTIADVDALH